MHARTSARSALGTGDEQPQQRLLHLTILCRMDHFTWRFESAAAYWKVEEKAPGEGGNKRQASAWTANKSLTLLLSSVAIVGVVVADAGIYKKRNEKRYADAEGMLCEFNSGCIGVSAASVTPMKIRIGDLPGSVARAASIYYQLEWSGRRRRRRASDGVSGSSTSWVRTTGSFTPPPSWFVNSSDADPDYPYTITSASASTSVSLLATYGLIPGPPLAADHAQIFWPRVPQTYLPTSYLLNFN